MSLGPRHIWPHEIEAQAYLDDLVRRKSGRLTISLEEDGLWRAHVEWDDGDPVDRIIGYTAFGFDQPNAAAILAGMVRDNNEGVPTKWAPEWVR